ALNAAAAKEAKEAAPKPKPKPEKEKEKSAAASFFSSWSAMLPLGDFLAAPVPDKKEEPLAKVEEWTEQEVETLKCKLRVCRWIPAARPPREWLPDVPWKGRAQRLWRPPDLLLMAEFWTCGAAQPLLDLEVQLVISGEQKTNLQLGLLALLGIPRQSPFGHRVQCAWSQLEAIRAWWQKSSPDRTPNEGASAWVATCLYRHVYPVILKAMDSEKVSEKELEEIFVCGSFVALGDLSSSQDFAVAGLHQAPRELEARLAVPGHFPAAALARGLQRLAQRAAAEERQLGAAEAETAVRLAIALSERIRQQGEKAPEELLVPTGTGQLRPAQLCVFNNMEWLSEEEQQKRTRAVTSSGLHWVHHSISNDVAQSLKVQGLSTQVAAEALAAAEDTEETGAWFEAAGQAEPLTARLKSLLQDMTDTKDLGLFKALLQNADDAQANKVHFVWDWRSFGRQSLLSPEMARWQGPCLWAHNDASFSSQDFENITQLGAVQKRSRTAQIGRFGLGFNSVYSLTDLPSILSNDVALFLDPHVHHLRSMCATPAKPGIKLKFLKFDVLDQFRDQFEPYHGMFGCDLSSSTSFPETLIRLPFRTAESAKISEISDTVTSPEGAMAFLKAFHAAAAECLIFLQHVQSIEFCWIPADAKPGATPSSVMQIQVMPHGIPVSLRENPPLEVSTDEQALQYRGLFSSRTVSQSKEKQSFISELMGRLGMATSSPEIRPYVSFNLVISIAWMPPPDLQQEFKTEPSRQLEAWRLILQHDNPADERWASAVSEAVDLVPFAGLALCLSRPLRPAEPRISCFLPLPIRSSLPFLINANFCLRDPSSPDRLDLARQGEKSDWNLLLLRNIVEPLICSLIQEQAAAVQGFRSQAAGPTAKREAAVWADGICCLMPCKPQLPQSLQELLNLPSIYQSLATAPLFPALPVGERRDLAALLDVARSSLLSFADSVQPLGEVASEAQRQAVHEFLGQLTSEGGRAFLFCCVTQPVAAEFAAAQVQRKAVVSRNLVLSCLEQHKDRAAGLSAAQSAQLLGFVLQDVDLAPKLQNLPLAPLCDGRVATFDPNSGPLYLASDGASASAGDGAASAQRVLQQLTPKAVLDISALDAKALPALRQHAGQLGLHPVETCEHLGAALRAAVPRLCAAAVERSSVLASIDETLGGRLLGGSYRRASAVSLGFGNEEAANSTLCALWSFMEQ
ncbi:unnamed protein product, partial [Effrenium voratum]